MGASNAQIYHHSRFLPEEWDLTPIHTYTKLKDPFYGSNFKVYTHKFNSNIFIQRYDLAFNSAEQFRKYKEIVNWRNTNRYLVSAKHIQQIKEPGICTNFQYAAIYIERIPVRLFEIEDVSLQEGLYILYAAAQGFQKLYQRYGYFELEGQMIGFTRDGNVKVWINKNLSKNYPENILIQDKDQLYEQFLTSLLQLIEKLIDFDQHITISQFIQTQHLKKPFANFVKTLQVYSKKMEIVVPRYLSSIRNLCQIRKKTKRSSRYTKFQLKTSHSDCNRSFNSKKNDKNLQLNNTVYNISVNSNSTPYRRSQFDKIQTPPFSNNNLRPFIIPKIRFSNVSKNPSIHFHYDGPGLLDSPKSVFDPINQALSFRSKADSVSTPCKNINQEHQNQSKQIFIMNGDILQMDPEIAADLLKMSQRSM